MTWQGAVLLIPLVMLWGILTPLNLVVIGAGLVWSLPGGFICWRKAVAKGLNPRRHALKGALYSASNIALWMYFMRRTQGEHYNEKLIRLCYIMLFAVWFITSVCASAIWGLFLNLTGLLLPDPLDIIFRWALLLSAAISLTLWIGSLVYLRRRHAYLATIRIHSEFQSHPDITRYETAIHPAYILPFVFNALCFVISAAFYLTLFLVD